MIAEREARGPFGDLRDFCRRIDLKQVNRRVLEALIRAGANGFARPNAQRSCTSCRGDCRPPSSSRARRPPARTTCSGSRARGARGDRGDGRAAGNPAGVERAVRLAGERETLGLYLTGPPDHE